MSKSLNTLIKVAKNEVDRQQKDLAEVQAKQDQILRQIEKMQAELESEKKIVERNYADHELAANFANFASAVNNKIAAAQEEVKAMEEVIEQLRDKLRESFAEQKKFEIVKAVNLKKEIAERNKKEAEKLDEMGTNIYIRKDNE